MPRRLTMFLLQIRDAAVLVGWCLAALCGVAQARAQGGGIDVQLDWAIHSARDVTFQQLAASPYRSSYQMDRVRRFLDSHGQMIQVRERLTVDGNQTTDSPFRLEFVGLVGAGALDPRARATWNEVYRTHAGLLHLHGGFAVHDPALAALNYRIYDFGQHQRIGRPVQRVVVFPNQLDKGIWLLDVDRRTGMVIYSAEYDANTRLLSELECTALQSIELGNTAAPPPSGGTGSGGTGSGSSRRPWGWQPRMTVRRYDSVPLAAASMTGLSPLQPNIQAIVNEYAPSFVQVSEDPVNGDRTLVLGYTDGVDEFFVLQTADPTDPLGSTPDLDLRAKTPRSHKIASYDDPAMRAYLFYENGVVFRVVGRGSLARLRDVSMRICRQAVTGV